MTEIEKKLEFLLSARANERAKRTRAKDSEDTPPPLGARVLRLMFDTGSRNSLILSHSSLSVRS